MTKVEVVFAGPDKVLGDIITIPIQLQGLLSSVRSFVQAGAEMGKNYLGPMQMVGKSLLNRPYVLVVY